MGHDGTVREILCVNITYYPKGHEVQLTLDLKPEKKSFSEDFSITQDSISRPYPIFESAEKIMSAIRQRYANDLVDDSQMTREHAEDSIKGMQDHLVSKEVALQLISNNDEYENENVYDEEGQPLDIASVVEPIEDKDYAEKLLQSIKENRGDIFAPSLRFKLLEDVYALSVSSNGMRTDHSTYLGCGTHSEILEWMSSDHRKEIIETINKHYDLDPGCAYPFLFLSETEYSSYWTDCGTEYDAHTYIVGLIDDQKLEILSTPEMESLTDEKGTA